MIAHLPRIGAIHYLAPLRIAEGESMAWIAYRSGAELSARWGIVWTDERHAIIGVWAGLSEVLRLTDSLKGER